jgi:hypothetical protein
MARFCDKIMRRRADRLGHIAAPPRRAQAAHRLPRRWRTLNEISGEISC